MKSGAPKRTTARRAVADPGFQGEGVDGRCVRCRRRGCHGHHVLAQQHIRDYVRSLRLLPGEAFALTERLLSDRRNRVWLCPADHERHEFGARPGDTLPRRYVPGSAWEFAAELGEWAVVRLERDYPG